MKETIIEFLAWYRPELTKKEQGDIADQFIAQRLVVEEPEFPCAFPKCKKDPKLGCLLPDCRGNGAIKEFKKVKPRVAPEPKPEVIIEEPIIEEPIIEEPIIEESVVEKEVKGNGKAKKDEAV